jgi:ribosomal protein L29
MAIIKAKEISKMNEKEIEEKIKDLRVELIKSRVSSNKAGKTNPREIKRTIARLLTIKKIVGGKK